MPTSGDTTWTLTAQDIISQALCDELGVFGFGESVTAEAQDHGLRHLIALMKSCKNSAHLESTGTVTIPAASASGTLGATMPVMRRPATSVVVLRWPCGNPIRSRSPFGQRP